MITNYDERLNANFNGTSICEINYSIHACFTIIRTNDNEIMSDGLLVDDDVSSAVCALKNFEEEGLVNTFCVYNGYIKDDCGILHEHFTVFYEAI